MIRYNATKEDIKTLKKRVQSLKEQIEWLELHPASTVDAYIAQNRKINALLMKLQAAQDALSRLTVKDFSKDVPEQIVVPNLINEIEI